MNRYVWTVAVLAVFTTVIGCRQNSPFPANANAPNGSITTRGVNSGALSLSNQTSKIGPTEMSATELPILTSVTFTDPLHGWLGTQDGILVTADGGHRWVKQYTGSGQVLALEFVNRDVGWAVLSDGLLRTTDGGAHWGRISTRCRAIDMVDAVHGAVLQSSTLWMTRDGGVHVVRAGWQPAVDSVAMVNQTTGYIGSGSTIAKTTDGGQTWKPIFSAPVRPGSNGGSWHTTVKAADGYVWAMVYGGISGMSQIGYVAYMSQDQGQTWQGMLYERYWASAGYPSVSVTNAAYRGTDPGVFWAGANGHAVFSSVNGSDIVFAITRDGGRSWTNAKVSWQSNPRMPEQPIGIAFGDAEHGFLMGNRNGQGCLASTSDGGITWSVDAPAQK